MRSKKLFIISSLTLLGAVSTLTCGLISNKGIVNFKAQAESYRFTMNSSNKVTTSGEINLSSATGSGTLSLTYSDVLKDTTGHVSLNEGGKVKNTSAFKGIQNISYDVTGSMKINYGKSPTRLIFEKALDVGAGSLSLSDTYSYFEIVATSEATINSLVFEYPCSDVFLDVKAPTMSFSSELSEVIEVKAGEDYYLPTVTSKTCDGKDIATQVIHDEGLTIENNKINCSTLGSYNLIYKAVDPVDPSLVTTKNVTVYVYSDVNSETGTQVGGVMRIGENSYRFPESKMSTNGVGNEYGYDSSSGLYGLNLNSTVLGGQFTIEFDVDSYKTNVFSPKLMVSLGKEHSQFYIASNYHETSKTRIESFTQSIEGNVIDGGGGGAGWNNSAEIDINASESHHYKIESTNGYYKVYVDSNLMNFSLDGNGRDTRTLIVPMWSFYYDLPVRISTNGVSCNVRNITVTSGTKDTIQSLYAHNNDAYLNSNNEPELKFGWNDWNCRWNYNINAFTIKELMNLTGNYTVKFKIVFSRMMADSKFAVSMGSHSIHFCAAGSGSKVQHNNGEDWNPTISYVAFSDTNLIYDVTISRSGDVITCSVPNSTGGVSSMQFSGVTNDAMYFWGFNKNSADFGVTAKLIDISVTY